MSRLCKIGTYRVVSSTIILREKKNSHETSFSNSITEVGEILKQFYHQFLNCLSFRIIQ